MIEFVVTFVVCSLDMTSCSAPKSFRAKHPSIERCVEAEFNEAAERIRAGGFEVVLLLACDYYWPEV